MADPLTTDQQRFAYVILLVLGVLLAVVSAVVIAIGKGRDITWLPLGLGVLVAVTCLVMLVKLWRVEDDG